MKETSKVTKGYIRRQYSCGKDISAGRISAQAGEIVEITSRKHRDRNLKVLDKIIAKDQTPSGKISSADFLSGLLGYGWCIDNAGRAEMRFADPSGMAGRARTALQLGSGHRFRNVGDRRRRDIDVQSSGSQCVVTLKLEEGDHEPVPPGRYPERHFTIPRTGFQTVMLRVDAVSDDGAMTVTPERPAVASAEVCGRRPYRQLHRQRAPTQHPDLVERGPHPDPDVDGWDVRYSGCQKMIFEGHIRIHPRIRAIWRYNAFLENIPMTAGSTRSPPTDKR